MRENEERNSAHLETKQYHAHHKLLTALKCTSFLQSHGK